MSIEHLCSIFCSKAAQTKNPRLSYIQAYLCEQTLLAFLHFHCMASWLGSSVIRSSISASRKTIIPGTFRLIGQIGSGLSSGPQATCLSYRAKLTDNLRLLPATTQTHAVGPVGNIAGNGSNQGKPTPRFERYCVRLPRASAVRCIMVCRA